MQDENPAQRPVIWRAAAIVALAALAAFFAGAFVGTLATAPCNTDGERSAGMLPPLAPSSSARTLLVAPRGATGGIRTTFAFERATASGDDAASANASEAGPKPLAGAAAQDGGVRADRLDDAMVARQLHRMFATGLERVAACYDRLLLSRPGAEGAVTALVTIAGSGQVAAVQIVRDDFPLPELGTCVIDALRPLRTATSLGARVVVELPLTFKPG